MSSTPTDTPPRPDQNTASKQNATSDEEDLSALPPEEEDERGGFEIFPGRRSLIKRLLPGTLMGRALMIVVTPMVLVQLVSTWVFYDRHWETMSRRLADSVAGDITTVLMLYERYPDDQPETLDMARSIMRLDIEVRKGEILPGYTDPDNADSKLQELLASAIRGKIHKPFLVEIGYFSSNAIIQIQKPDAVIHIVAPRERLFSSTTYIFLMWMLGSSMVLFAVAMIFMRNQIRPVHRLAEATDRFGRGLDVPNFKPEGGLEVRRAAAAFNIMRRRINRQIRQRTEMLAGVSHDLRTPLTRMKLNLAMLPADEEVDAIRNDIAEMETMIEGYLAFARGEGTEKASPTVLHNLLAEALEAARRGGANVACSGLPPLELTLRPRNIRRAFDNLLGNAHRYGGNIEVSASCKNRIYTVLIDDDGPGIPADRRSQVFQAFFRLDASRNRRTGGVGLGLAIARDAIRSHGGDITLEDSPMGGLRARVTLPF